MFSDTISENIVNAQLRQMGAVKIKSFPAYVNIVTFMIDEGFEVQYVYEMKENENNYLERVTPVPYHIGEPKDVDELVEEIRKDLELYKEVYESKNFPVYFAISKKAYQARRRIEQLFLADEYAELEDLERINRRLDDVLAVIDRTIDETIK